MLAVTPHSSFSQHHSNANKKNQMAAAAAALPNFCLNKNPAKTLNPVKTLITTNSPSYRRCRPLRKLVVSSESTRVPPLLFASPPPSLPLPKNSISKFFVEKAATVLLGSLVFIGSLNSSKPVFAAQPVHESSDTFEEKRDDVQQLDGEEEEAMCLKLLQGDPKSIDALKTIVNVKMKKGKTGEAVGYVERLIELQPNEMEWRLLQALCYEMMGDLARAKSLFKNILKQKPLLLRALHGLAMVMHKNREGPAVFEMLERALQTARRGKRFNKERNIRILIAQMHIIKGDLEEAVERFQALIDENPRDFRPYLCQGIVYSLMEKRKEAEESFEIYRNLVPEEFPQRVFLDDVVLAAKTETKQQLEKELQS